MRLAGEYTRQLEKRTRPSQQNSPAPYLHKCSRRISSDSAFVPLSGPERRRYWRVIVAPRRAPCWVCLTDSPWLRFGRLTQTVLISNSCMAGQRQWERRSQGSNGSWVAITTPDRSLSA